jgi:hypothetical protein
MTDNLEHHPNPQVSTMEVDHDYFRNMPYNTFMGLPDSAFANFPPSIHAMSCYGQYEAQFLLWP